jgi:hypothetical protein
VLSKSRLLPAEPLPLEVMRSTPAVVSKSISEGVYPVPSLFS